jgi:hypothetical protein
MNQAGVTAMIAGQQLRYGGAFAVAAGGQYKCLVGPFHGACSSAYAS